MFALQTLVKIITPHPPCFACPLLLKEKVLLEIHNLLLEEKVACEA
jgi:hypothetical protein